LVWFTERIFREDRWIVEREQEAHDAQGADWNHEVFPVINELRDLLRQCGARTVIPIRDARDGA
ncbi:aromatic ring-hydroxylating dioxygenase subunit alpha, partial [Burkholderia contaminans]|nr:aromatic ring-hydroxylating dioxygenase subunit alpha [Burkholderia contaminans]